ncbi:hypothetical protein BH23BAC1_BH23BAC1_00970 [soil metagenome]
MLKDLNKIFYKLPVIVDSLKHLYKNIDNQKMLTGKLLAELNKKRTDEILSNIQLAEFKVFSQWGDDGIIQFLIDYLQIEEKSFVEFGVESYREATTRFLLMNNNWRGLLMDGSHHNINLIKGQDLYWRYDLTVHDVLVTKENINELFINNNFTGEIGLLHIDIDGNDYWVWKEINEVNPVIVIIEYNSVFGHQNAWTVPYDPKFYRTNYHKSNLYFGSSLMSLCDIGDEKGYYFVGCNSSGNNAYFVRKDKIENLKPLDAEKGYVLSRFRESRDIKGKPNYLNGNNRLEAIKGMEIYNTRTGQLERI